MALTVEEVDAILRLKDELSTKLKNADSNLQLFAASSAKVGGLLTAGLTLPLLAIGGAAVAIALQMDDALDTIRVGTGATGAELVGLEASFDKVFTTVPVGMDQAATAIADLNTRTGATGATLEALATQLLNLARITGTDVAPLIATTTRFFGDWSVATEDQAASLDFLFRTSQTTGIGVEQLSARLVQFGAPLRQFGFGFEEAAALMGKWEKEGVNSELVLGSLRIAMGNFARENVPLREGLQATIARIQELGPGARATATAMEIFGARAGPDMAAAILEGRFEIDGLLASLKASPETIAGAAAATDGFKEKLILLKNNAAEAFEPIGVQLLGAIERLMPAMLSIVGVVASLAEKFANLSPTTQTVVLGALALVAAIGPLLVAFNAVATTVGVILPLLPALGTVIAVLTGPIGLVAAAVTGLVLAWKNWDTITEIAKAVYVGVKTWLVDQFTAIVDKVKAKIDAVVGFFKGMYDQVIGQSSVPDTINAVSAYFSRLDAEMAGKTKTAVGKTVAEFAKLKENILGLDAQSLSATATFQALGTSLDLVGSKALAAAAPFDQFRLIVQGIDAEALRATATFQQLGASVLQSVGERVEVTAAQVVTFGDKLKGLIPSVGELNGIFQAAFVGGGGALGAVKSFATQAIATVTNMIPVIGPIMSQFSGAIVAGFQKIGGALKALFGGPSAKELAGREVVENFEKNIQSMLTDQQRLATGNESWKQTVVVVRDAYLALGKTEQEALAAVERLWASSKGGADAVAEAMKPIEAALRGVKSEAKETEEAFRSIPTDFRINVDWNIGDLLIASGGIPMFQEGGLVRETGLAFVHAGEVVVPPGGGVRSTIPDDGVRQEIRRLADTMELYSRRLPDLIASTIASKLATMPGR